MSATGLQRAVHGALISDPELHALVADRVYDRVPDRPAFPYVTYGGQSARALDGEGLTEHVLTLEAWSRGRGRSEALAILEAVRGALTDLPPLDPPWRLVSLRMIANEAAPARNDVERASLEVRAVTEPTIHEGAG